MAIYLLRRYPRSSSPTCAGARMARLIPTKTWHIAAKPIGQILALLLTVLSRSADKHAGLVPWPMKNYDPPRPPWGSEGPNLRRGASSIRPLHLALSRIFRSRNGLGRLGRDGSRPISITPCNWAVNHDTKQ
ncbi:hypothetical protein Micbo1qcDRAFT_24402 [Microdochium bolleyi]|uniref:Uncharacterized protein n=1 Tax=Microdochium bolleyi TaxID=196109 RepID=A0A136JDA9_9PEZI|nr:hypothetical protein Micbo1qcDRAFT_24402 [Microdochium bolleyi]